MTRLTRQPALTRLLWLGQIFDYMAKRPPATEADELLAEDGAALALESSPDATGRPQYVLLEQQT